MDFENDNHSFTFRFHSAEGERDLEMRIVMPYILVTFLTDSVIFYKAVVIRLMV